MQIKQSFLQENHYLVGLRTLDVYLQTVFSLKKGSASCQRGQSYSCLAMQRLVYYMFPESSPLV